MICTITENVMGVFKPCKLIQYLLTKTTAAYLTSLVSSSGSQTQPLVLMQELAAETVPVLDLFVIVGSINMFTERYSTCQQKSAIVVLNAKY